VTENMREALRADQDEDTICAGLQTVTSSGLAEYTYEVRLLLDDVRPAIRVEAIRALSGGANDQSSKAELDLLWRVARDDESAAAALAGWVALAAREHGSDVTEELVLLACDENLGHPIRSAAFRGVFRILFGKLTPAGAAAHRKVLSVRDIKSTQQIRQEIDRAIAVGLPSPSVAGLGGERTIEQRCFLSDDGGSAQVIGSTTGALPAELFAADHMIDLELQSFNSPVPSSIGDLVDLQRLNVVFGRNVPVEPGWGALPDDIDRLRNLTKLQLIGANMPLLPETVATLEKLDVVRIEGTGLDAVPNLSGSSSSLTRLLLSDNRLNSLDDHLGSGASLHTVVLDGNRFTAVPASLRETATLKLLSMRSNVITTFPEWLLDVASLEHLDLAHNEIAELPHQDCATSVLTRLDLSHNNLTSVASLGTLTSLQRLDLSHNMLSGIPDQVLQLPRLQFLDLRGNASLPADVAKSIPDHIELIGLSPQ